MLTAEENNLVAINEKHFTVTRYIDGDVNAVVSVMPARVSNAVVKAVKTLRLMAKNH
jgi:hypothetical protein